MKCEKHGVELKVGGKENCKPIGTLYYYCELCDKERCGVDKTK